MSSDNGVYVLQSKDGFRVTHAQAIDNLYWWNTDDPNTDKWEKRDEINPEMLIEYFGDCKVFKTEGEAVEKAFEMYNEICYVEYGVSFIRGWEDKEFPKSEE